MSGREKAGSGGQDAGFVKEAFAKIADRYVVTNHVLSAGTDILWRKKVGRIVSEWEPKRVLDVATGTGDLALEIQKACPNAEVIGTDFCEEMLAHATRRGVSRTMVADGTALPFEDQEFDVVTVAFGLRNMADWGKGLREMARVAKQVLVLDFSTPQGPLEKPYCFYLNKVLPKIAGALTGQGPAYEYLAGSIEKFPSGAAMQELFEENGLVDTRWIPLSGGIASIYTGRSSQTVS
ncbi:MAG: ubiquinone/menaquinone biosynthesis methyltransferase [Verrucomicrobiota bacterium JB023]|nr:ubiquinone/menaquinone biosynthesis methyltransferase [Verrucomicrobiota bacterium JB023]